MSATDTLEAENAWLRERLAKLIGTPDLHQGIRMCLSVSPKQASILALLIGTRRPVSMEAIYENVYQHPNGDGPDEPIVRVAVSQLRQRLTSLSAPDGIQSAYGTGCYSISPAMRQWLTERLETVGVAL